jgi:hypothetical protein
VSPDSTSDAEPLDFGPNNVRGGRLSRSRDRREENRKPIWTYPGDVGGLDLGPPSGRLVVDASRRHYRDFFAVERAIPGSRTRRTVKAGAEHPNGPCTIAPKLHVERFLESDQAIGTLSCVVAVSDQVDEFRFRCGLVVNESAGKCPPKVNVTLNKVQPNSGAVARTCTLQRSHYTRGRVDPIPREVLLYGRYRCTRRARNGDTDEPEAEKPKVPHNGHCLRCKAEGSDSPECPLLALDDAG